MKTLWDLWHHPAAYLFHGPMWRRRLAAWRLPKWYDAGTEEDV